LAGIRITLHNSGLAQYLLLHLTTTFDFPLESLISARNKSVTQPLLRQAAERYYPKPVKNQDKKEK